MSQPLSAYTISLIILLIVAFIAAAFGNLVVVAVRISKRHAFTTYRILILHLAVTDFLFTMYIPVEVDRLMTNGIWTLGTDECKLFRGFNSMCITASVGTMAVMAYERYRGITNALGNHHNPWKFYQTVLAILGIWVFSAVNFIPYIIALEKTSDGYCTENITKYPSPSMEFRKGYTIFQLLVTYVLPLLLVGFFNLKIVLFLREKQLAGTICEFSSTNNSELNLTPGTSEISQTPGTDDDFNQFEFRRVVKILTAITVAFALCGLPGHIYYLLYDFNTNPSLWTSPGFKVLEFFAYFIFVHSATNPIIYSILDNRFRKDARDVFKSVWVKVF